jgi:hypothetical protein
MLDRTSRLDFDYIFMGHSDIPMPKQYFQTIINVTHNASMHLAQPYNQIDPDTIVLRYEEDGIAVFFRVPMRDYNSILDHSLPVGNLGVFQVVLRDNFLYGNGYQALIRNPNLLGGHRLRRGDVFTLRVTYTANRDLENELLVGFTDMSRRWRTLSYTQRDIEPPNVVLGPASRAGEEISSEVTITLVASANASSIAANTLVLETLGQGRHRAANSGTHGPVTVNFSEFVLIKH